MLAQISGLPVEGWLIQARFWLPEPTPPGVPLPGLVAVAVRPDAGERVALPGVEDRAPVAEPHPPSPNATTTDVSVKMPASKRARR